MPIEEIYLNLILAWVKTLKKILVTGYGGFIGSNLTERLAKRYDVVGVSNTKNSISHVITIRKDIRKLSVDDIPRDISHIVHLAAISDLGYCQKNPSECFDVNVQGTQNLLEISRKIGSSFLFASTYHVYGMPIRLPMDEKHPRNPGSIYASSKLAGEIISESYARNYNMNLSIVRLSSIYGPSSPDHLVISKIISQMKTSNQIKIGNLYPRRDFVYVDDVVGALELVAKKSSGFQVFNVGSGKSFSIKEICRMLQQISGKGVTIRSVPQLKRKHEIPNLVSDISKIAKLGWRPKVSLRTGLEATYEKFVK